MRIELKKNIFEAILICFIGLAIGFAVNLSSIVRVFKGGEDHATKQVVTACSEAIIYARHVELGEMKQLAKEGAFLIDARPWELFVEGHIPGAMSVAVDAAAEAIPTLESNIPKDASIVVYCRGGQECTDSEDLGKCLVNEGYENVKIFTGGLSEWKANGLPVN